MNHSFIAACAAFLLSLSATPAAAQSSMPGIIEVNGLDVRVMTGGFEHLERGRPIVVFESGELSPIYSWQSIIVRVAEFDPVVAYKRPGIGKSEFDGEPRTLGRTADHLRAILAELEAPAPVTFPPGESAP